MRSKWVKNWLARRDLFGHMPLLKELNKNEPNDLKNYLRMAKPDFDRLLATGRSYEDLKFNTGIAAQTLGYIIPETCRVIYEVLQDTYMKN
ncbi:hypothetical protein ACI65C_013723 [Semiaphis heraclei]